MIMRRKWCALAAILVIGCGAPPTSTPPSSTTPPPANAASTILFSVTSDANDDPQSVDMALKLAGFSLDEERHVVLFFNVKGVTIPTNRFPDDAAFQEEKPFKSQLAALIDRGVDVHVCPICMKALGVAEADLIDGAKVTTRPSLFENIGADTAVFTY